MTNERYTVSFKGGANDLSPNVAQLLMQGCPLQVSLAHVFYKQCPAAFDTGNDVATIAHRTLENLLTRRSPWSAEVKALQINSWAARLNFIEDLMKAYDDLLDLDADESVSESIDAFADKLSKVTHKISHDTLVINMERVHEATASATVATQDVLPHPHYNTSSTSRAR